MIHATSVPHGSIVHDEHARIRREPNEWWRGQEAETHPTHRLRGSDPPTSQLVPNRSVDCTRTLVQRPLEPMEHSCHATPRTPCMGTPCDEVLGNEGSRPQLRWPLGEADVAQRDLQRDARPILMPRLRPATRHRGDHFSEAQVRCAERCDAATPHLCEVAADRSLKHASALVRGSVLVPLRQFCGSSSNPDCVAVAWRELSESVARPSL